MNPKKVVIYSKDFCPYCVRAKNYFQREGISYEEIDLTGKLNEINELKNRTGHMTLPQIFIDDEFIGGYDDLMRHVESTQP